MKISTVAQTTSSEILKNYMSNYNDIISDYTNTDNSSTIYDKKNVMNIVENMRNDVFAIINGDSTDYEKLFDGGLTFMLMPELLDHEPAIEVGEILGVLVSDKNIFISNKYLKY